MFEKQTGNRVFPLVFTGLLLLTLFLVSFHINYLLFHVSAEFFSITVAAAIFLVAWNTRNYYDSGYLLQLGIAFLFIAIIDFFHTLTYEGMNIITGYSANLPTQLWIAARYLEALSFFFIFLQIFRKKRAFVTVLLYCGITILILISIFTGCFPDCYIAGEGLTAFKKISEYIIISILIGSIVVVIKKRDTMSGNNIGLLISAMLFTIISEFFFTLYISVFGISNIIGHLSKVISFYLIYEAIIKDSLKKPFHSFFTSLQTSNRELKNALHEKNILMKELNHRVKNNLTMLNSLISMKEMEMGITGDLTDLKNRIDAVRLVHEELYKTDNYTSVPAGLYIRDLVETTFSLSRDKIKIEYDIEEIELSSKTAVYLGLIINEIATNTIKYGMGNDSASVFSVTLRKDAGDNQYTLVLKNSGPPLPDNVDTTSPGTMGMRLIKELSLQLKGELEINSAPSPQFSIRFSQLSESPTVR